MKRLPLTSTLIKPDSISKWAITLSDLLFPIACLNCGAEGVWLCSDCARQLPYKISRHCPHCGAATEWGESCLSCRREQDLLGAISFVPYAEPIIQEIIHAWKYQGGQSFARALGDFVLAGLRIIDRRLNQVKRKIQSGLKRIELLNYPLLPTLLLDKNTALVPVPLHRKKLRQRGFNQAHDLALAIAAGAGYPVWDIIERTKHTSAQATLRGPDRFTNIKNAFRLKNSNASVLGKNVLIVDDVITTGHTAEEIAKLLKRAGAASIWALTIAYGHPL